MSFAFRSTNAFWLVAFSAPMLAAQQVPTVRLTAPTAKTTEGFSAVASVVELSNSRLLVADQKETRIALVDLKSGAVKTLGGKGAGPGEYRYTDRLLKRPGGGAYLVDFVQRRLLPIADDGTLENTIAFPSGSMQIRGIDAKGTIYADGFLPRAGKTLPDTMWLFRWDPTTRIVDSLFKYDAAVSKMIVLPGESFHPFSPRNDWQPTPAGDVVIAHAAPYQTSLWHDKTQARLTPIPWEPVRVTESEKAAFLKEQALQKPVAIGGAGATGARPPMTYDFPATKAAFENGRIAIAPDGRLWIEKLRAHTDTLPTLDVVDVQSGRLMGRVVLPYRASIAGFGAASVYVAVRDDDDIVQVWRYASPVFPAR